MNVNLPRGSVEFLELDVRVDGAPAQTYQVAVASWRAQPTTWADAYQLNGKRGVLVSNLPIGLYAVWARILSNPEAALVRCGSINVI